MRDFVLIQAKKSSVVSLEFCSKMNYWSLKIKFRAKMVVILLRNTLMVAWQN